MTFWADNIKFIKDVLDSKYKKIEDALTDVSRFIMFFDIKFSHLFRYQKNLFSENHDTQALSI